MGGVAGAYRLGFRLNPLRTLGFYFLEQLTFRSGDVEKAFGFDAYRELYSVGSDVGRIGEHFLAETDAFRFPRMLVMDRTLAGLSHERSHKRVATDGFDHVNMQLVVSGRMLLSTADTPRVVEPGQIAVFDMTRPQRTWTLGARIVAASLPRDLVAAAIMPGVPLHGLVLSEPHCALLGDVLRSLVRTGPSTHATLANAATSTVAAVFGATLGSVPDKRDVLPLIETAKRERAITYIERVLHQPDLSADVIGKAVGMSRSALYRVFEPLGGVARYIQQRRLVALRRTLSRPSEIRPFSALAQTHGFVSASHANRSFKEVFGITPGDFRSIVRAPSIGAPAQNGSGRETLARWSVELL